MGINADSANCATGRDLRRSAAAETFTECGMGDSGNEIEMILNSQEEEKGVVKL